MGRQIKRVHLKFKWELRKVWPGYINPFYGMYTYKCDKCEDGYSAYAKKLQDKWYGYVPFAPAETGSTPFESSHEYIQKLAKRNYPDGSPNTVKMEANRLTNLFNSSWSHHLSQEDIDALLAAERLQDFTHDFISGEGWKPKANYVKPTLIQVRDWSIQSFGHDGSNSYICIKAKCERDGQDHLCDNCKGEHHMYYDKKYEELCENFEQHDPPEGEGYQLWETVSEGSPISPVFAKPEDLANWLVRNSTGLDAGTTYDQWIKFILGPGWAPSMIINSNGIQSGVAAGCDSK